MERFVSLVERGYKRQTIRRKRRVNQIKVGDMLILSTGIRTPRYREIKRVVCVSVEPIAVYQSCVHINGERYHAKHLKTVALAIEDGFKDYPDMVDFFANLYSLPFKGVLIRW
jgi:hypothetical protein